MGKCWVRLEKIVLALALLLITGTCCAGDFNVHVYGDFDANSPIIGQNVTDTFSKTFPAGKFEVFIHATLFTFQDKSGACYAEVGVRPWHSSLQPKNLWDAMYEFTPDGMRKFRNDSDGEGDCVAHALDELMHAKLKEVWPPYVYEPDGNREAGFLPQANAPQSSRAPVESADRFTTKCSNLSCVRTYPNGQSVQFVACMNPETMLPMMNGNVANGRGDCSGVDSQGNPYGTGHLPGAD